MNMLIQFTNTRRILNSPIWLIQFLRFRLNAAVNNRSQILSGNNNLNSALFITQSCCVTSVDLGCVDYFIIILLHPFWKLHCTCMEKRDKMICITEEKKSYIETTQGRLTCHLMCCFLTPFLSLFTEYFTDISSNHRRSTENVWRTKSPSFGQSTPGPTDRYKKLKLLPRKIIFKPD